MSLDFARGYSAASICWRKRLCEIINELKLLHAEVMELRRQLGLLDGAAPGANIRRHLH